MSDSIAIQFENVSKMYRIYRGGRSIRKDLHNLFKKLTSFGKHTHEDLNAFWALKEVNFSVKKGETLGIVGVNGSGKSTTLKLISRVTYPTQGRITTVGKIASLIEVGAGFHLELSGRENIFLNGSILGMTQQELQAKLPDIIQFAELEEFIDMPIKRYSSGMRARLGFSIAIHVAPEILLVDEVLSVGDENFRKKSLNRMQELMNSGCTVIFISHNLENVASLCPRVIWLDKGQLKIDDTSEKALQLYQCELAKRLEQQEKANASNQGVK